VREGLTGTIGAFLQKWVLKCSSKFLWNAMCVERKLTLARSICTVPPGALECSLDGSD